MDRKKLLLALLAAALSTTVLSAGAKATSLNITPTIGTYVLSSSATSFFWNYEPMYFESSSSSRAYLKFSISSLYSYYGSGIYSANLCLFAATHDNGGGNTYGIDNVKLYNNTNQTWGNSTNWNTRIDSGSADTGYTIANFPIGTWRCTDVTNIVKTYLASGYQNATFEFRSPSTASNRTGYPNFMNATHRPYLAISTSPQANGYTYWENTAFCVNSSATLGTNVSCSTPGFWAPTNCVNFTTLVYSNITTPEYCGGQFKSIYLKEPYPDDVSYHQVSQNVLTSCGNQAFNTTMYNTLAGPEDLVKAWGECTPYSNQSCSIRVNVTASCMVPNPSFTWQFPNQTNFKMNYGEAVAFYNILIASDTGGESCWDINLTISDRTFARVASGTDIETVIHDLNGAINLPSSLSFDLCPGQGYPFITYFDPANLGYGGTIPNSSVIIAVNAKVNGTSWATKLYDVNVTGTFVPIGECNYNGVCELGESNSFCWQDCPAQGQTGTVPCQSNCTTEQSTNTALGNWYDSVNAMVPENLRLVISFVVTGILSVVAVIKAKHWEVGAIVAIITLIGFTAVAWLNPIYAVILTIGIGFLFARSLFGK